MIVWRVETSIGGEEDEIVDTVERQGCGSARWACGSVGGAWKWQKTECRGKVMGVWLWQFKIHMGWSYTALGKCLRVNLVLPLLHLIRALSTCYCLALPGFEASLCPLPLSLCLGLVLAIVTLIVGIIMDTSRLPWAIGVVEAMPSMLPTSGG